MIKDGNFIFEGAKLIKINYHNPKADQAGSKV